MTLNESCLALKRPVNLSHIFKEFNSFSSNINNTVVQAEIFQGRGAFVELGHFVKLFVKNTKKGTTGKNLELFLLDTLKTTF